MKRIIIIAIMSLIVSGLIVFEYVYVNGTFKEIEEYSLSLISDLNEAGVENAGNPALVEKSIQFDRLWDSKKKVLLLFYNQLILNDFEMKLARLNAAITASDYPMALTETEQIYRSACEQQRLVKNVLTNIL